MTTSAALPEAFGMDTHHPANKLIVALDVPAPAPALEIVDRLGDAVRWYKVGLELYTAAGGAVVRQIRERGKRTFLDLKLHDIPTTVARASRLVGELGVDLFNVHAAGGVAMMQAAKAAATEGAEHAGLPAPHVYGVTVLTSLGDTEVRGELGYASTAAELVLHFADLCQRAGLHGVVASPRDAAAIRACCGPDLGILTPGIRPAGSEAHDHARASTPGAAVRDGATYLVVGRAITQAEDPVAATHAILEEMGAAL